MIINKKAPQVIICCPQGPLHDKLWEYIKFNSFIMEQMSKYQYSFVYPKDTIEKFYYYNIAEGGWFYGGYPSSWGDQPMIHARDFLKELLEYEACEVPPESDLLTGLDTPYWQTADHKESPTVSNSSEQQKTATMNRIIIHKYHIDDSFIEIIATNLVTDDVKKTECYVDIIYNKDKTDRYPISAPYNILIDYLHLKEGQYILIAP